MRCRDTFGMTYLVDVLVHYVRENGVDVPDVEQVLPSDVELLLVMLFQGKLFGDHQKLARRVSNGTAYSVILDVGVFDDLPA